MTGRDDELLPEGVPAFDDAAYDGLRAELADLQDVGPMPAEVAARLDEVLADLGGTPAVAEPLTDSPVVPLRRRSNAGRRLLVAAAAVVAVGGGGIGLANVVDGGTSGDDGITTTADSAVAESAPDAATDEAAPGVDFQSGGGVSSGRSALELRSQNFSADAAELITSDVELVTQLRRAAMAASTKGLEDKANNDSSEQNDADIPLGGSGQAPTAPTAPEELGYAGDATRDGAGAQDNLSGLNALQRCAVRAVTGGVARPVLLDGSPAILVVYPAVDGTRLVQARSCDANTVLISAFVPVS